MSGDQDLLAHLSAVVTTAESIAAYYTSLVNGGVPEDAAANLTMGLQTQVLAGALAAQPPPRGRFWRRG